MIANAPTDTKDAEKVVEILLDTKEGKEAVDVTHSKISLTAFTACMRSFKSAPLSMECSKMKDALTRVLERLVRAGANFKHPSIQTPILAWVCQEKIRAKTIGLMLQQGATTDGYILANNGATCLISAVENAQLDTVNMLLSHGVDVNETGPSGKTPFSTACKLESKTCLTKIVNHNTFRFKSSELSVAEAILSQKEMVSPESKIYSYSRNIAKKEEIKRSKKKNKSKLFELVSTGDLDDLVKGLNNCSVSDIDSKGDEGMTILHMTTTRNDYDMVEAILERGASVNVQDNRGYVPIMYAARNPNSLEILDLLIGNGADINAKDISGKTAVFEAAQANRVENVEYLTVCQSGKIDIGETTTGTTPIHLMAQENNTNILSVLSKTPSFNVNVVNASGATPLHYAAKSDSEEATKTLIEIGAAIDMKCSVKGNAPLHVAAACDSKKVAHILIQKGADINVRNSQEETPLFVAAMTGSKSVLSLLLDEKAEIDAKNIHGQTPLYIAANYEEYESARLLVDYGADIMAREIHREETVLHLATSLGNTDFIRFLIDKGADREARDCQSLTPFLRCAIIENKKGLSKCLIELGCNLNATLAVNPMLNFLDIIVHNNNMDLLKEFITSGSRTNKPGLHHMLSTLPKESKEKAMRAWELRKLFDNEAYQGVNESLRNSLLSMYAGLRWS